MIRASAVLTAYGRPGHLDKALASLRKQDEEVEIIVVEDGGPDLEIADVVERHGALHLRREDRPKNAANNIGPLMNAGARAAFGELLILFNQDMEAQGSDWVRKILARPAENLMAITASSCSMRSKEGKHVSWLNHAVLRPRQNESGDPALPAYFFVGTAMRRKLFENLGGFDEDFLYYGFEDWELGFRAAIAGALYETDDSLVLHHLWHEQHYHEIKTNEKVYRSKIAALRAYGYRPANMGKNWGQL